MKKYDNYVNVLKVLQESSKQKCQYDMIYRSGVISHFNLTFELAWKLLQEVLRQHAVADAETGSPREIIKLGFAVGFVKDESDWLDMQKDRNISVHIYNSETVDEIIDKIYDRYITAFQHFAQIMAEKIKELDK